MHCFSSGGCHNLQSQQLSGAPCSPPSLLPITWQQQHLASPCAVSTLPGSGQGAAPQYPPLQPREASPHPPRLPPTATHWQHQPWEGPPVLKCDEQSRIQDILLRFPRVVSCKGKERKDIQIKACAHTGRVNIYAHARAHTYICTVYAHTLYMNSICPHTVYIHHMHTHTTYIHSHYTYICIHKYICTYCICMQHTSLCTHTYIYSICIHAHTFTHCTCTLYIYPHTVYAHYTLTCTHTI